MLTVWSRIIEDLANSNDDSSHKLAMLLIDDVADFYRVWACQETFPYWYQKYRLLYRSPIRTYISHRVSTDMEETKIGYNKLADKWNLLNKQPYVNYME